jgi:hypothetical protein
VELVQVVERGDIDRGLAELLSVVLVWLGVVAVFALVVWWCLIGCTDDGGCCVLEGF